MRLVTNVALVAVVCCLFARGLAAATFTVTSDPGDGQVDVNGVPVDITLTEVRPGTGGGSATTVVRGQASVFFFHLPALSPDTIASAELQWSFLGLEGSPEFNLDVFGLGLRASATMLSSDYYAGNSASGSGTLLGTRLLTPGSSPGDVGINATGYLQSLYNPDGTPQGNYLVVRVNPDAPLPAPSEPIRGYYIATGDNHNSALQPRLTIVAVPEPSTITLLAIAGITVAAWGHLGRRQPTAR